MRTLICAIILLLGFVSDCYSDVSHDAEAVTKRFAESLARFDVAPMVDELHSDVRQTSYLMAIHIIETTDDEKERADLLKSLGVASIDEFKKLTPKAATVRFFEFAFSTVPKQVRDASVNSKITIVGSIVEKDMVHVLYRSQIDLKDFYRSVTVPSVVTLKREGSSWKVASTTQLETMKAKLHILIDGK